MINVLSIIYTPALMRLALILRAFFIWGEVNHLHDVPPRRLVLCTRISTLNIILNSQATFTFM